MTMLTRFVSVPVGVSNGRRKARMLVPVVTVIVPMFVDVLNRLVNM